LICFDVLNVIIVRSPFAGFEGYIMYFVLVLACSPPEGINIEDLGNVNLISRNIQKHLAMIPLPQEVSQLEL